MIMLISIPITRTRKSAKRRQMLVIKNQKTNLKFIDNFTEFSLTFDFSGLITVYINGVATEIPRGPLDMKAMFGQDFVLFHSSGVPVQVNEYGFLMQSLQHGESYFLVSNLNQIM